GGSAEELRRVLEEAARRFANPAGVPTLPSEAESAEALAKTRAATLEAVDQMPDFVVKQLVTRSHALGMTQNWTVEDRLVVGVSYRVREGEQYRLLAVNGKSNAYDIPAGFAFTGATVAVDYDWVTIAGQGDYLLPSRSVIVMTLAERGQLAQFRNDIRFRNYQKFGTELKIIEDDIIDEDVSPEKPKKP